MKQNARYIAAVCLIFLITALVLISFGMKQKDVSAYAADSGSAAGADAAAGESSSARAIVSLSITLDCGDSMVWATAKNDFTFLPATVIVSVELYSSGEYTDNYQEMTLAASNSIDDLNIGKSITAEASTGGEALYWIGVMRYKVDSGDWKIKDTGVCKISGTGELLGYR